MGIDKGQEINLLLVTDREIRKYNRRYLRHDRATDVIAFGYLPLTPGPSPAKGRGGAGMPFGDIVISLDTAKRQARMIGHTLFREVQTLAVHGLLHLLGYRDKKKKDRDRMWRKTDSLLALVEKS